MAEQIETRPTGFQWGGSVSLKEIARHYLGRISVTWLLLLGEAVLLLLFPLAIGYCVDTLLQESNDGLLALSALCVAVLIFAAGRRFYDTRAYAAIYRDLATRLVAHKHQHGVSTTRLTAQVKLLQEVVEFFEDSMPELISAVITFIGVVVVLALMDWTVMAGCLAASVIVGVIYGFSEARIFRYNRGQNDELEKQVDVVRENRRRKVHVHFGRLAQWNIRLSDMETLNFSGVWVVLATLMLGAVVVIVQNAGLSYGQKITAIMYVFEYIEVVMSFPLFYQQIIRLREITTRLSGLPGGKA
ncbi:MAG: ABC transporter six-transmembrane domain-containing protein [Pseudomonadota bacterium]